MNAGALGLFLIPMVLLFAIIALMALFMPFAVWRIRKEAIRMNEELANVVKWLKQVSRQLPPATEPEHIR